MTLLSQDMVRDKKDKPLTFEDVEKLESEKVTPAMINMLSERVSKLEGRAGKHDKQIELIGKSFDALVQKIKNVIKGYRDIFKKDV